MVDATRPSEPGRELAALGRGDVPAATLDASAPVRRREADGLRGPAPPGGAGRERPRPARSRGRAREIVAATIWPPMAKGPLVVRWGDWTLADPQAGAMGRGQVELENAGTVRWRDG